MTSGPVRRWARRTAELYGELAAVAEVSAVDPRWWFVAGGAAAAEQWIAKAAYVASDAEPSADTFIGHVVPAPADPIADAIARAHAARAALRELDGELPEQPLAVTIRRTAIGAAIEPSALELVAFAIGERRYIARLADDVADEGPLAATLAGMARGEASPGELRASSDVRPFVTVTLGDEAIATARHGHRRGWIQRGANGTSEQHGPWLGLSRAGELAVVSTCHMVVDGYGHAWLAARIADHAARLAPRAPRTTASVPPPAPVVGAVPLAIAWRALAEPAPRALPLAYALGRVLHELGGRSDARYSPTFQIPVAPGERGDPLRRRRRVVPAIASVRFDSGAAEELDAFAARTREQLLREARGHGLTSRLLAAARGAPAPLAWKRRAVGPGRPRWLKSLADVLGGSGCVSRIQLDMPSPPACAVSAGGLVVTVIDDGARAAITACGDGASEELLDRLLELVP